MPRLSPPLENLARLALEDVAARVPRRLITRNGTKEIKNGGLDFDGKPYMYRSYLNGAGKDEGIHGILLHKFVSSDEIGELHSHPWKWSLSFILVGSYKEIKAEATPASLTGIADCVLLKNKIVREYKGGDVNFIRDIDYHRVELLTPEVWTLFVHGPRVTTWGFVEENYNAPVKPTIITKRTFDLRPEVSSSAPAKKKSRPRRQASP